ncbi:hypothetical protein MM239_06080 [Belliella sp. DSM 111904]|uniref:DUF551 domain-containing protein n=1 Tax=Belliella filtrata TaxID=2923435 RepID=A0ABS9UYD0_9BACT|nr:hypothetical protein [Belliella filtrata]MCH7408954.1 hypothetical protein [Belliella filtrata]
MKKEIIREQVNRQIKEWIRLQNELGGEYSISPKAIDFVVEVVENIQEDPSSTWQRENFNYEASQERAISLVPEALNDIIAYGRLRSYRRRRDRKITSWEIWHSLSRTIEKWCFVPKEV